MWHNIYCLLRVNYNMAYSDYSGMRGLGASGSYGAIPNDIYMRKIEQTDFYEDPDQVENHMRSMLTDLRPDKPFLAAHEARSGEDRGGGFASSERLALRHTGSRSGTEAWLPDGVFLEHEFTERDPRGSALGPDMRKHAEQQYARASLIKLYDDSDYSVPESGITPTQMVSNIKSGMYQFKDRFQNFDTSMDGWSSGAGKQRKLEDNRAQGMVTLDGTITDLSEASVRNRQDATARLSADPTIAYRHSTPDHRVKIARYGLVKARQFMNENNWSNNRLSTFEDQSRLQVIDGQLVNKQLASFILDVTGQRDTKQAIAQGADYGDSYNNQLRNRKISAGDLVKINMMIGQLGGTQTETANQQLDGKTVNRYGQKKTHNNRNAMNNTQINHEIIESMKQATRDMKNKHRIEESREKITQSAADNGVYREASTSQRIETFDATKRETKINHFIEDGKTTMNYSGIKPSDNHQKMSNLAYENFGDLSRNTKQRRLYQGEIKNRSKDNNEYEQNQNKFEFGVYDKAFKTDAKDHIGRGIQFSMDKGDSDFGFEVGSADLH